MNEWERWEKDLRKHHQRDKDLGTILVNLPRAVMGIIIIILILSTM
jgi:hypothetical protein